MKILDKINSPFDIKGLTIDELNALAGEIRDRILEVTSRNGGHVAPNLGAVELTLAIHYVFNAPDDKIIWDVGHQCYTHKLLTGRNNRFDTLRQYEGISGFPKRQESVYDVFDTGHAGTSLSAAFGLAKARDIQNSDYKVVAVIGDGSIISGMAFEALNNLGTSQTNIVVILNDNAMSIARNTGALSAYLNRITSTRFYQRLRARVWNFIGRFFRTKGEYLRGWARRIERGIKGILTPGAFFETLGFHYFGPLEGHSLKDLIFYLQRLKEIQGPVLVHVATQKGRGFKGAIDNPELFHGVGPYDLKTCKVNSSKTKTYSEIAGCTLAEMAGKDERIVAITAGMTLGTGLDLYRASFPARFYDFGITEEHCVTFAAGLALKGLRPVFAVYSTFLQRAFDQIIHDVALQNLPVVFAIDRAGLVGADGPTHHGVFDLSYLRMIPNMVVAAPKDEHELRNLLYTAIEYEKGPFAIRYPRSAVNGLESFKELKKIPVGAWEILRRGKGVAILAAGRGVELAEKTLKSSAKINPTIINARFVKPLDERLLLSIARTHHGIITVEENALIGGFGAAVAEWLEDKKIQVRLERIGLPDYFIEHGPVEKLFEDVGFTSVKILEAIKRMRGKR